MVLTLLRSAADEVNQPARGATAPRSRLSERDRLIGESLRLIEDDRLGEARGPLKRALEIEKDVFGAGSDPASFIWWRLVHLETQLGEFKAAREVARQIIAARGERHWMAADAHRAEEDVARAETWGPELRRLYQQAASLEAKVLRLAGEGKSGDALVAAGALLEARERLWGKSHHEYGLGLYRHGALLRASDPARAAKFLGDAHMLLRDRLGPSHPYVALCLFELGILRADGGDLPRALELIGQAAEIQAAKLGRESEVHIRSISVLAQIHERLGRPDAEKLLREALKLIAESEGEQSVKYGRMATRLGGLLVKQADWRGAAQWTELALEIFTKAGIEDDDRLTCTERLASEYRSRRESTRALPLYRDALRLARKLHGDKSTRAIKTALDLGNALAAGSGRDEAAALLRDASTALANANATRDISYLLCLMSLGSLQSGLGDHRTSATTWKRGAEVAESLFGKVSRPAVTMLQNLALELRELFDLQESSRVYEQALERIGKHYGERSKEYAACLDNLGINATMKGDARLAKSYYEKAAALRKDVEGEKSEVYAGTLSSLGTALNTLGEYAGAEKALGQSLAILETTGVRSPYRRFVPSTLQGLATASLGLGRYERAEQYAQRAIDASKQIEGIGSPAHALSLSLLGGVYLKRWDFPRAEQTLLELRDLRRKTVGERDPLYAQSLSELAQMARNQGQFARAAEFQRQAVAIIRGARGPKDPSYGTALKRLGEILIDGGDTAAAEPIVKEALEIVRTARGPKHPDTAYALMTLADLDRARDRPTQAMEHYRVAERIMREALGEQNDVYLSNAARIAAILLARRDLGAAEKARRDILTTRQRWQGERHPETIAALTSLGSVLAARRQFGEAESTLAKALALARSVLGENARGTADVYREQGVMYQLRHDAARETECFEKAMAIYARTLGEQSFLYIDTLSMLGISYGATLDYDRALATLKRAAGLVEKSRGQRDPRFMRTLHEMAHLEFQRGNLREAEVFCNRALELRKAAAGEESVPYAESLEQLGQLARAALDFRRAETLFDRAIAIREKRLGRGDPSYADALEELAAVAQARGDSAKAVELCQQASQIKEKALGPDHPDFSRSLSLLGLLYLSRGQAELAETTLRRALEIRRKAVGERHPDFAESLSNLGAALRFLGDYPQAERNLQRALAVLDSGIGQRSPNYAAILDGLGGVSFDTGDLARAESLLQEATRLQRLRPTEHRLTAWITLQSLGSVYASTGDWNEADAAFLRACNATKDGFGAESAYHAFALLGFGLASMKRGELEQAEHLIDQAVAIAVRSPNEFVGLYGLCLLGQGDARLRRRGPAAGIPLLQRGWERLGREAPAGSPALNGAALSLAAGHRLAGQLDQAEAILRRLLADIEQSLSREHPTYARALLELATVLLCSGDRSGAEPLCRQALDVHAKIRELTAAGLGERRQLAMTAALRRNLDLYLSLGDAVSVEQAYERMLDWKGVILARQKRLRLERKLPDLAPLFSELDRVTSRLATLVLQTSEPGSEALAERARSIRDLTQERERLEGVLAQRGAALTKPQALGTGMVAVRAVGSALPADAALVDFLEYSRKRPDATMPSRLVEERALVAFVVRHGRPVRRIELGPVAPIEGALKRWRPDGSAIVTDAANELRDRLWTPLASELAGAGMVLVSPDGVMARIPFAALPGKAPGSYLIEEIAVAVVAVPRELPALVESAVSVPSSSRLVLVGDVDYGAEPGGRPTSIAGIVPAARHSSAALRSQPLALPDLPGTATEIDAVGKLWAAQGRNGPPTVLRGAKANEAAIRSLGAEATYLHLATHGFFRSDPARASLETPQTGFAGLDPLGLFRGDPLAAEPTSYHPGLLSGIALAGANRGARSAKPLSEPGDDGILTALEVAELDLAGTRMAVLSACDTGLGRPAGGEGLLGLQRAFAVAGARTVVASLWQVDDQATAALMIEFYKNLWEKKLGTLESLRQAQLTMLRHYNPGKGQIERGLSPLEPPPAGSSGREPRFWAAFVLSGDWR
jgi:tetratricopeptide (TPR) repeat protein/CHAT domain-containing protein